MLVQDILFVATILLASVAIVAFLYKAVRAGYRRAMIEHMQNMTESSRYANNGNGDGSGNDNVNDNGNLEIALEPVPSSIKERKPYIGMYKVHMLAPNTAQYGRRYAVHVPAVAGVPLSAYPDIDMRNPWSLADIEAAEVPEKEGCRKSATGLFHECGVLPANHCE